MPPQEPQYLLVDSNDNTLGAVYVDSNDDLVFYHDASGNEVFLGTSGLNDGTDDYLTALGIEDSGVSVIDADNLNFGADLSVTDDGDGTVTVDASTSSGGLSDYDFTFYVFNDGGTLTVLDSGGNVANTSSDISTALQYTVDNLPSGGGEVILSDDSFATSTQVQITSSGYTLRQVEGGDITVNADISLFDVAADDVTFDNITWTGNGNATDGGVFVQNEDTDTQFAELTVSNCDLSLGNSAGLIRGVDGIELKNNRVYDFENYGLHVNPQGTATATNIKITGNYYENFGFNAISVYKDADNFTIFGNTVINAGHSGIAVSTGERGTVSGNVVKDVTDTAEAGIEVEFKDTHGSSASRDVTVAGNMVDNCTWGVFVGDRDNQDAPENVTVTGNTLTNCGTALFFREGSNLTDSSNTFRGNTTDKDVSGATDVTQFVTDGENVGYEVQKDGTDGTGIINFKT